MSKLIGDKWATDADIDFAAWQEHLSLQPSREDLARQRFWYLTDFIRALDVKIQQRPDWEAELRPHLDAARQGIQECREIMCKQHGSETQS